MNISSPPPLVRRFWRSRLGQFAVRVLEPSKYWVAAFIVGIVAVNVWTLTIYRTQAKDEATHAAEIVANADGQYHSCVGSIPLLTKINRFIEGVQIVDAALVANSRANLRATPKSSSLYALRRGNLERLQDALNAAAEVKFPVPNRAACGDLHSRLLSQG